MLPALLEGEVCNACVCSTVAGGGGSALSCIRLELEITRVFHSRIPLLQETTPISQETMQPSDYLAAMLERVNQERTVKSLPPLRMHSKLQAAAQRQADDMAAHCFMSHQGSDGSKMAQRAADAGFTGGAVAENVAAGQKNVNAVVDSWMKSPGHRRNILGNYTVFGAAYAFNSFSKYKHSWTQVFGRGGNHDMDDDSDIPWTSPGHDFSPEATEEGSASESDTMRHNHRKEEATTVPVVTCTGCWCFWV